MNDIAYGSAVKSLGHLIDKLGHQSEIMNRQELNEIVINMEKFYSVIDAGISELLEELRQLRYENAELSGDLVEIKPNYEDVLPLYQSIHDAGGDVNLVCKVAIANKVDKITIIKIIRWLFNLSLEEAFRIYYSCFYTEK